MPLNADIEFDSSDRAVFPTKHHGEVTLSKVKWGIICSEPERWHFRCNGEKIATTLVNPDLVRHHKHEPNQFFYYKEFSDYDSGRGDFCPPCRWVAVIVDVSTGRICTVYPVDKPKAGKPFKPEVKS